MIATDAIEMAAHECRERPNDTERPQAIPQAIPQATSSSHRPPLPPHEPSFPPAATDHRSRRPGEEHRFGALEERAAVLLTSDGTRLGPL